jgi:hypothetical protein
MKTWGEISISGIETKEAKNEYITGVGINPSIASMSASGLSDI